jgi:O-antigen/teichoic acid export membrane protein
MAAMASVPMTPADGGGAPTPAAPEILDTSAAGPAAIRGGALRVGAYLGGTALGVLSTALLFRHLGVVNTGRYSLVISLVAIISGLSDLGLTAIGVRELSVQTGAERDSIARNLLGLRLVLSAVGAILIVGFAALAGYGTTIVLGVLLASVGLILQSAQSTLAMSLISDLKLGWVAAFEFLRAALTAALVIGLVLAGAHLLAFLAVTIPAGVVVLALNVLVSSGRTPLMPAFHSARWWRLVRDVLPYSAAVAAATLYFYLAVILVSLLASSTTLGYFSVSSRVIQVLLLMPGLAVGAAFPIFSRAARDDHVRLAYALGRVFEVSLLVGVLVSLSLAVGASVVVEVVGGPKFAPASTVLAIQGVGLGASFVGAVWSYGLLSLGRYRDILTINLLALLVGGVLVAVLVSLDGARGAAIATAIDEVALAGLNGVALARASRSLAPPLRIIPPVGLAVALAAATTLLEIPVLASVALASAVYAGAVFALGVVPDEVRQSPWRALRGRRG